MHVPSANYKEVVLEREIRTVRSVMSAINEKIVPYQTIKLSGPFSVK